MNEKTTIRFVLTGVKYSQSDLGKHYKTFCGLYLKRIIIGIVRDNGWADFYPLPESARGYSEKRKPA